jgi:hypothetical protein
LSYVKEQKKQKNLGQQRRYLEKDFDRDLERGMSRNT